METSMDFTSTFYKSLAEDITDLFPEYALDVEHSLRFTLRELGQRREETLRALTLIGKELEKSLISCEKFEMPLLPNQWLDASNSLPVPLNSLIQKVWSSVCWAPAQDVKESSSIVFLVRQWFLAFSKVKDIEPETSLEEDFASFHDRMKTRYYPFETDGYYFSPFKEEFRTEVLPVARELLAQVFYDEGRLHPSLQQWISNPYGKHGSGAVYGKEKGSKKWNLNAGRRIQLELVRDAIGVLPTVVPETDLSKFNSRVQSVPKDLTKRRLICIEPKELMFAQQGLMSVLYDIIGSSLFTRSAIHLFDQSKNFYASRKEAFSTIDLSDASDMVSLKLVKLLLPKEVFAILTRYRSSGIEFPDGSIVAPYTAFATMGNALCFPVESLVFWSLSLAAILIQELYYGTYRTVGEIIWVLRNNPKPLIRRFKLKVFGDDIIVPSTAFEYTCEMLKWAGMVVNTRKSCGPFSPVRESCGSFWYHGIDVRIVKFHHATISNTLAQIALADQLSFVEECGLNHVRDKIRAILPPYFLGVPMSQGFKDGWLRWQPNGYQRLEARVPRLELDERVSPLDGRCALYAHWTNQATKPLFHAEASKCRIKWEWVPVSCLIRS